MKKNINIVKKKIINKYSPGKNENSLLNEKEKKLIHKAIWSWIKDLLDIGQSEKEKARETSRKVLWIALFTSMYVMWYDMTHSPRIENGIIIFPVSANLWNYLEVFFISCLSLYGVRKTSDAIVGLRSNGLVNQEKIDASAAPLPDDKEEN